MSTFVQIKRQKKTRWGAVDLGGMRSGGWGGGRRVITATSFETEGEPSGPRQMRTQTAGVSRRVGKGLDLLTMPAGARHGGGHVWGQRCARGGGGVRTTQKR